MESTVMQFIAATFTPEASASKSYLQLHCACGPCTKGLQQQLSGIGKADVMNTLSTKLSTALLTRASVLEAAKAKL